MPDLHSPSDRSPVDIDRAFDALTADVTVRAGRPGAAAAMATARRRRRTTLGAAAAVVALSVGAVLLPQVAPERLGLAADLPASAPLDVAALEEATDGWITGWTADDPVGSFTQPGCIGSPSSLPPETTLGRSSFAASTHSGTIVALRGYETSAQARASYDARVAELDACRAASGTVVGDYPPGTEVRHYRTTSVGSGTDRALTDIWVAVTGQRVGVLEGSTSADAAPDDAVAAVADALVAGLRSGWVQDELEPVGAQPPTRPQLPRYDERGLTAALDGWRAAEPMDEFATPSTPCLATPHDGVAGSGSADRQGPYLAVEGYAEPGRRAAQEAERVLEGLRECREVPMTERRLGDGVTVMTYDRGGPVGHGAVWVGSSADRVMLVSVDGADAPVPGTAADAAGAWVTEVLDQPWPRAH